MKKISLFIAITGFLFLGVSVDAALAQGNGNGNGATVVERPFRSFIYNRCCNDFLRVEGTLHQVRNKNGTHMNVKDLTAVGRGGREYTGKMIINSSFHRNDNNDQQNRTLVRRYRFVSDDGCSFTVKFTYHYTVNANGELVVSRIESEFDCEDDDLS